MTARGNHDVEQQHFQTPQPQANKELDMLNEYEENGTYENLKKLRGQLNEVRQDEKVQKSALLDKQFSSTSKIRDNISKLDPGKSKERKPLYEPSSKPNYAEPVKQHKPNAIDKKALVGKSALLSRKGSSIQTLREQLGSVSDGEMEQILETVDFDEMDPYATFQSMKK